MLIHRKLAKLRSIINKLRESWVLVFILALCPVHSSVAATLSRDINTYVLFGLESLSVKGRNGFDDRGFIVGGNVGVNADEPNTNSWLMELGANGYLEMSDNTQVVADSLRADEANVYDVFVNRLNSNSLGEGSSTYSPRGDRAIFTAPIIAGVADSSTYTITGDLPQLPFSPDRDATNNAADVIVETGATKTLDANMAYGELTVKDNAVLNLGSGTYDFRNVKIGKGVVVNVTDQTILQIDQGFFLDEGSTFGVGTRAGAKIYVGAYGLIGSNDNAVTLGRGGRNAQNTIYAQLYSPFGDFNMGNHSNLYGRFWARSISDDWNTNVTFMDGMSEIPAPATIVLLLTGLLGIARIRKRSRGNMITANFV